MQNWHTVKSRSELVDDRHVLLEGWGGGGNAAETAMLHAARVSRRPAMWCFFFEDYTGSPHKHVI